MLLRLYKKCSGLLLNGTDFQVCQGHIWRPVVYNKSPSVFHTLQSDEKMGTIKLRRLRKISFEISGKKNFSCFASCFYIFSVISPRRPTGSNMSPNEGNVPKTRLFNHPIRNVYQSRPAKKLIAVNGNLSVSLRSRRFNSLFLPTPSHAP